MHEKVSFAACPPVEGMANLGSCDDIRCAVVWLIQLVSLVREIAISVVHEDDNVLALDVLGCVPSGMWKEL